jgi:hypothetical protein
MAHSYVTEVPLGNKAIEAKNAAVDNPPSDDRPAPTA